MTSQRLRAICENRVFQSNQETLTLGTPGNGSGDKANEAFKSSNELASPQGNALHLKDVKGTN